jgi:hypothetical protein
MHGLFLSEIDPPAIGHNFWTAFKNQRLTSSGVSLFGIVQVLDYTCTQHSARFLFWAIWADAYANRIASYIMREQASLAALSSCTS